MCKTQIMVWVTVCTVLCGRMVSANSYEELIEEAKSRIVSTQDCTFNRDIEITLKKGQALRLDCPTNEHQIVDFLLYYYENMTMKEIGATLSLSESRVSQMHTAIVDRLRSTLDGREGDFLASEL